MEAKTMRAAKTPTTRRTTTIAMDEYTRAVVDTAAKYTYQTRTDFILSAAREKAERIAKERTETLRQVVPIVLSEEDSKVFLDALEQDFKPNQNLIDLQKQYHALGIEDRT